MEVSSVDEVNYILEPDVVKRLNGFMARTRAGVSVDFRSKIYEDQSREQVLQKAMSFSIPTGVESFDAVERTASEKFGPYSVRQPYEDVSAKVYQYFKPKRFDVDPDILDEAVHRVSLLLRPSSLHSIDLTAAFEQSAKDTNWGLPLFSSDKKTYLEYLRRIQIIKHNGWRIGGYLPCVLGVRSQPAGINEPSKWRPLWMADHAIILAELAIQIPLLNALRRNDMFVAWTTPAEINLKVSQMLNSRPIPWISSDFSGYDASIPEEIVKAVFDLFRYWFSREDKLHITWIEDAFLNVSLYTPDGILSGRRGGVPSGLGMTNMVDTLGQMVVDEIVALITHTNRDGIYLGDDGVKRFTGGEEVTPELYSKICEDMNLVVSPTKSLYSERDVDFLQRRHTLDYVVGGLNVGFRSQIRTANSVISFETFPDLTGYELSLRAIQQVEQCSDDPRFLELVNWLYEGDNFLHSRSPSAVLRKAGGVDAAEEALKIRSYPYNQRDLSELTNFRTVQAINSLKSSSSGAGSP